MTSRVEVSPLTGLIHFFLSSLRVKYGTCKVWKPIISDALFFPLNLIFFFFNLLQFEILQEVFKKFFFNKSCR